MDQPRPKLTKCNIDFSHPFHQKNARHGHRNPPSCWHSQISTQCCYSVAIEISTSPLYKTVFNRYLPFSSPILPGNLHNLEFECWCSFRFLFEFECSRFPWFCPAWRVRLVAPLCFHALVGNHSGSIWFYCSFTDGTQYHCIGMKVLKTQNYSGYIYFFNACGTNVHDEHEFSTTWMVVAVEHWLYCLDTGCSEKKTGSALEWW